jgi:hypothetical protein
MPVARYFLFVGGALLALLLAINAFLPQEAAVASNDVPTIDKTVVRIRSDQKPPERVVYDTSLPTIVPPTVTTAQAPTPPAAPQGTAEARVRDTFAQFVPGEAKKAEPQVHRKRKIARSYPTQQPPMLFGQQPQMRQMRVAQQQQRFGLFGGQGWNTW